ETAHSLEGLAHLERRLGWGETLWLIPALTVRAVDQSLDRKTVRDVAQEVDQDVYSEYNRIHPLTFTARLGLWWTPYADQIGAVAGSATVYDGLSRVDTVAVSGEWR